VPDQGDQHLLHRVTLPCVAEHHRHARVQVEGDLDVAGLVARGTVEAVDRHHERRAALLEVIDGREGVRQPPRVGEHHRADRAVRELVPHEPEALLAGRAEQVQDQVGAERDPPEVHRDRGGGLAVNCAGVIHADAPVAERLLGAQRPDLADRADQGGLPCPEPAGDEDLEGRGHDLGESLRGVRVPEVHPAPP
jgi:hypothetical protein